MSIHYITFRASVHATESDDRVKTALSLFLFNSKINETQTEGHFGNPITLLQGQVRGKDYKRFIDLLKSSLPEYELEKLRNERCERIDEECCLHIRFDKQAAFEGKIRLATTADTITAKIKLKAYPANYENAIVAAEALF
ncbi:MAG: RNA-binding domain-containing protein [Candidatus Methanoperedens sp.]